jgi:hypothetical protein
MYHGALHRGTRFSTNHEALLAGSQHPPNSNAEPYGTHWHWGHRRLTPRQACPKPNGFGRNLRSKTRWFTGFCNSHQVSHFATFFIDARAEISVAESHFVYNVQQRPPAEAPFPDPREHAVQFRSSLAHKAPGFGFGRGEATKRDPLPTQGRLQRSTPQASPTWLNKFSSQTSWEASTMILPQVHLRKPCYDFSFL